MSREEVRAHQRDRIFRALETVMAPKGYAETSVADIIKGAGVSRQTFYELFSSKQDCFLASYSNRQGAVIEEMVGKPAGTSPMERLSLLLEAYLAVMAKDPDLSRLYLIGVYTAGPEAIGKRLELQQAFVDVVAGVLEVGTAHDRFVCQALVAATSTLVTNALLEANPQAVRDLHQPLLGLAQKLMGASKPEVPEAPHASHSTKR